MAAKKPALHVAAPGAAPASFVKACQLLLADESLSENKAATRAGCKSWSYHKKVRLGVGPIDRAALRKVVNDAGAEQAAPIAPAGKRSSPNKRRRLSETSAAPAAGAALATREAAAIAPIVSGSGVLGELLERLVGGGDCTRVVGTYRLELNLRLVPVPADRSGA